jgi:hypothetical protein
MAAGLSLALVISATVAAPADATGAHRPPHITYVTGNPARSTGGRVVIHGKFLGRVRAIHLGRALVHNFDRIDDAIYLHAPRHAPGSARITVTNQFGTSQPVPFRYLRPNPLTWTTSKPFHPWGGEIQDVACTGPNRCAAVDPTYAVTFDGNHWSAPVSLSPTERLRAVACGSSNSCMAFGLSGKAWTFDGSDWSAAPPVGGNVSAVSCATAAHCVAVNYDGLARTLDNGTWSAPVRLAHGYLWDVSCPTTEFCAVSEGGAVAMYDGVHWTTVSLTADHGAGDVKAVDCPSATFCAAVDDYGNVYTYDDGTWSAGTKAFEWLNGRQVACASATDCVALDLYGDASHWDGQGWSPEAPVDTSPDASVHGGVIPSGSACIPDGFCYYGQSLGEVLPFDGAHWGSPEQVIPPTSWPASVSCWAEGHCMESDDAGSVQTLDGTTWSQAHNVVRVERTFSSVSCASATLCALVAADGRAATFDGASWSDPVSLSQNSLTSASCASTAFCMALGSGGIVYRFDGHEWSAGTDTGLLSAKAISCADDHFCVAVGGTDAVLWNGTSWTQPVTVDPSPHPGEGYNAPISAVSCSSETYCVLADTHGYTVVFSHGRWGAPIPSGVHPDEADAVSCISRSFCVVSTDENTLSTFDGTDWTDPAQTLRRGPIGTNFIRASSCALPTYCVSVGAHVAVVSRGG